jgi:apolipoprotein N-acyltransferase
VRACAGEAVSVKLPPLKNSLIQRSELYLLVLAAGAGLLLALAFPKASIAGLAWIAPGILLFLGIGQGRGPAFRIGYVGGLTFNLSALYWLLHMPVVFLPILGWLTLSAYCALYPALWVWLANRLAAAFKKPASETALPDSTWPSWLTRLARTLPLSSSRGILWALGCAALWVALEFTLCRLLSGFPWLPLGMSQYQLLPVIQIASITGVHGVSFLVVWVSVALGCAAIKLVRRPKERFAALAELALPLVVTALCVVWGSQRLLQARPAGEKLKLALVQPSIPQTMIWDPKESTSRFNKLIELSRIAIATKPDLLVWPEAAIPNLIRYDVSNYSAISNLVTSSKVWMIVGADDAEPVKNSANSNEVNYFNSSFLITPAGQLADKYDKRRLVIFGEFVPLSRWLPFLKYFTPIEGGFTPGTKPRSFTAIPARAGKSVMIGMSICFEDVFPAAARDSVDDDTDFLLNLTNNGWFAESAAQWQHAANAVFRALENGVPLVRCTNNGLTCWIDERGRLYDVYFGDSRDIYGAGFKVVELPLRPAGVKRAATFYSRHGEWFPWACVAMTGLWLLASLSGYFSRQRAIST